MIKFQESESYDPETYILRNGAVCLYYSLEPLEADVEWFKQKGYKIYVANCTNWDTLDIFHEEISNVLEFPSYYGQNMNAFKDSIHSLEFKAHRGALIVFLHYDIFAKKFPQESIYVLEDISTASRRYLIDGHKLIALVQTDDPNTLMSPLGANAVPVNLREMFL